MKTYLLVGGAIKKKVLICILLILLIIISGLLYKNRYNFVDIKDNYFAVISSGAGERIINTYLYFENGKYSYIEAVNMTKFWGSPEWETTVIDVGKFKNELEVINLVPKYTSAEWITCNIDVPERELNKGDVISAKEFRDIIENVTN